MLNYRAKLSVDLMIQTDRPNCRKASRLNKYKGGKKVDLTMATINQVFASHMVNAYTSRMSFSVSVCVFVMIDLTNRSWNFFDY